jgi:hypothetical protein
LGIPIFGSDFWDPHCKRNSDSIFNSKDSDRNFPFEIPMSGESENRNSDSEIWDSGNYIVCVVVIENPHKKTDTYSSIDTKVNGRKPSPYKMEGELFFPPNLHLLTLIGKQTYIYSLLLENEQ